MEKAFAIIIALVMGASLAHAQGYLQFNSNLSFGVTTNTGAPGFPGISGQTFSSPAEPFGFYYTCLFIPTGTGTSQDFNNLTDGNWVQLALDFSGTPGPALIGTNYLCR